MAPNPSNWVGRVPGEEQGSSNPLMLQRSEVWNVTPAEASGRSVWVHSEFKFSMSPNPGLGLDEIGGLALSKLERVEGTSRALPWMSPFSSKPYLKQPLSLGHGPGDIARAPAWPLYLRGDLARSSSELWEFSQPT